MIQFYPSIHAPKCPWLRPMLAMMVACCLHTQDVALGQSNENPTQNNGNNGSDSTNEQDLQPKTIAELRDQLSSPSYDLRSVAAEQLLEVGFESVGPVAHLLKSDQPETVWRASKLLLRYLELDLTEDQSTRVEAIIDLATASGHTDLIDIAIEAKRMISVRRVHNEIEKIRQTPGIQIDIYPVFRQQIIVNRNGQIFELDATEPEITIAQEPTTLQGAQYAKENFHELVDSIVDLKATDTSEIISKLRKSGIQLALVDTPYQKVSSILNIVVTSEFTEEHFSEVTKLCKMSPSFHLSLVEVKIDQSTLDWLKSLSKETPLASLSLNQCFLKSQQLKELESSLSANQQFSVAGRAMLGIRGSTLMNQNELVTGATVSEVTVGSGAEAAGILPRDHIIGIDGVDVQDFEHLRRIIACYAPEDEVEIIVKRPGTQEPIKVKVELKTYSF